MPSERLTVGIFADLPPTVGGGVNQFARGLVGSLAARDTWELDLVVFAAAGAAGQVPASPSVTVVEVPAVKFARGAAKWWERARRYRRVLRELASGDTDEARFTVRRWGRQRAMRTALRRAPRRLDVIHFPFQDFVPVNAPSIFCPWDLQHRHLADLWTRRAAAERDAYYRRGCALADLVVLASEWAREDLIRQFGVPREKTTVVRIAPPTRLAEPPTPEFCEGVRGRYGLPPRFILYPAVTWPHKNHVGLINALAEVVHSTRSDLHLVCCGKNGRNMDKIGAHITRLGMSDLVHFLGHVDGQEVRALYRLALLCAFPTLFEGAGLPVLEAFDEGCPLVAANVTCVPEYAGNAALLFNPRNTGEMAGAIRSVAESDQLRSDLIARGDDESEHTRGSA